MASTRTDDAKPDSLDFIRRMINSDLAENKNDGRVATRFPPEPNGFLHIGHAKAICLDFGIAEEYGGTCNLRFDDTNPSKEETKYVESIKEDVRWLGFDWGDRLYYASDYFEKLYEYAVELVEKGKAYVCDLTSEQIREYRGTLTEPGRDSPCRDRSVEENLELFRQMRAGEFFDGSRVLRARIDMASPNMNMRDPIMYRVLRATHHRTGDQWCIYPTYDWAHGLEDAIEEITHSLCTLEFENHRPLYDWFLDQLDIPCHPQQTEFARLNLTYTVLSKRMLSRLVQEGCVNGWGDPRMPTLSGMRRRGYPAEAIRNFCEKVGVTKYNSISETSLLDHCLRDVLNKSAPRVLGVLDPLKVVIDNFPEGEIDELDAINNPENPSAGTRKVPFSKNLYIERDDFMEDPPKKFYRLGPGREVRLRYGYFITCVDVVKDPDTGEVVELHCTYDPETRGGSAPDGRKVRGTIHWVAAETALNAEVRLYDRLFLKRDPTDCEAGEEFIDHINPDSLEILTDCLVEPSVRGVSPGTLYQFERKGYFYTDPEDSGPNRLVFNRTIALRDSWAKIEKQQKQEAESRKRKKKKRKKR